MKGWNARTAKRTDYNGRKYRSQIEAEVARVLTEAGVSFDYETRRRPYVEHRIWLEDFAPAGQDRISIEVKGALDPDERRKLIAIQKANPNLQIILVLRRLKTRISKGLKALTYEQWAKKHGLIPCTPETLLETLRSLQA